MLCVTADKTPGREGGREERRVGGKRKKRAYNIKWQCLNEYTESIIFPSLSPEGLKKHSCVCIIPNVPQTSDL